MRLSFLRGITIAVAALTGVTAFASGSASQKSAQKPVQKAVQTVTPGIKKALGLSRAEFVSNAGQWNPAARYLAQVPGLNVWVTDRGLKFDHFQVVNGAAGYQTGQVVSMEVQGLTSGFIQQGQDLKKGARVYSKNGKLIQTRGFRSVLGETRDGSAAFRTYTQGDKARYDLIVRPGTKPETLKLAFKGADKISATERTLTLKTKSGRILHQDLVAYQTVNGKRVAVPARFVLNSDKSVGFKVGAYDRSRELVIDPLVYGTYVGGNSGLDEVRSVVADPDGGVYLVGRTGSALFPITAGPYGFNLNGSTDLFVTKLEGDAYAITYSAFIGGSGAEFGQFAKLDPSGNLWVAGTSTSTNFPGDRFNPTLLRLSGTPTGGTFRISYTVGATTQETADIAFNATTDDINAALRALPLLGATVQVNQLANLAGARYWIEVFGQATNARGTFAVSNNTLTGGNPTVTAPGSRIFVLRLKKDPTLVLDAQPNSPVVQTFYTTGTAAQTTFNNFDVSTSLLTGTDAAELVIAGGTSRAFPLLSLAEPSNATGYYIRFNYSDSRWFRFGTGDYIGGPVATDITGAVFDSSRNLVVAGTVTSSGNVDTSLNPVFITTSGVYTGGRILRGNDVFVRKYTPTGAITASALLGGNDEEYLGGKVLAPDYATPVPTGSGVAVDAAGSVYLTGVTSSFDFPRTRGVFGENFTASPTIFVTKLSATFSTVLYSTNLRDTNIRPVTGNPIRLIMPSGIAVDSQGSAYVTGIARQRVTFPADTAPGDPNQPASATATAIRTTTDALDPDWTTPAPPEMPTQEGFLNVLNPTGTNLVYGTYIGGLTNDFVYAPYVDGFGDVWLCGWIDGNRGYSRVSSGGTPTVYDTNGDLPGGLLSPLAFKSSIDRLGPPSSEAIAYGNQAEPGPFANFPGTVNHSFTRDGYVVKLRVGLPSVQSLILNPNSIPGGQPNTNPLGAPASTVATVTLSGAAPAGGATVQLTLANLNVASFDAAGTLSETSITIPAGQTTGTVQVFSKATNSIVTTTIRATYQGSFQEALLTVSPWLRALQVSPSSIVGGNTVVARITLNAPAPVGGATITLASDDVSLATFANLSVTIPQGQDSIAVDVTTLGVDVNSRVTIRASLLNFEFSVPIDLAPASLSSILFNPPRVATGGTSTATLALNGAAGPSGITGTLSAGTGGTLSATTFTFPAQARSVNFDLTTDLNTPVTSINVLASTASRGSANGTLFLDNFALINFTITPATVNAGVGATGTVTIANVAPAGGVVVALAAPANSPVTFPATVTIPAGSTNQTFAIGTRAVGVQTVIPFTASRSGQSLTANLTIRPITLALAVNPGSLVGGITNSVGTVTLSAPAPVGGLVVSLSVPGGSPIAIPASVTVLAGQTTATFPITTSSVATTTLTTITASVGSITATAQLQVRATGLSQIILSPTSVRGGSTTLVTLRVILDGPAPAGGVVVNLSYSSTSLVGPASVTIPAGQTEVVRANLITRRVSRDVQVTATGTAGSRVETATILIRR